MVALIVILSVLGFLLIVFLGTLFYIYWLVFYSPHKGQNDDYNIYGPAYDGWRDQVKELIDHVRSIPYEDVYIYSKDKKKLHARLLRHEGSNKVGICCHGYHGTACRDFSGGAARLFEMGYNVLMIDERAHGQSEGHTITFGKKEQYDILGWIDYIESIFSNIEQLVLIGISMGGASVLMASDKVKKPIKIIADCPYNVTKDVLGSNITNMKLPVRILYPLMKLAGLIYAHINIDKGSAIESVNKSKCQFLIIHGTSDNIVPHHFSEEIYLNNKDKVQYELFPDTAHGMSYLTDTKRYVRLIKEFLNK